MTSSPLPERAGAGRGIALVCIAVVFFICMDATAKYLAARLPVLEVIWARYLLSWLLAAVVFAPRMGWRLWRTRRLGIQLVRGVALVSSTLCFVSALVYLPLAEALALGLVSPILVALMSGPWLGERVSRPQWIAIGGGFMGVLIVLRPGGGIFQWAALLPLVSAAGYSVYLILTRKVSGGEHPVTSLFYGSLAGAVGLSLIMPWVWQTPPDFGTGALMVLLGVLGATGHFLLIKAFEMAPAATLAPYAYTQMVWAILLGYVVFGDFPDTITLVGIAVIVSAALGISLADARRRPAAGASAAD
jgi:drug/metabolite transporter (DMT)-like permease